MQRNTVIKVAVTETKSTILRQVIMSLQLLMFCIFQLSFWYRNIYILYSFFLDFFLMWTLLKVCIEFVTILLPFYVLVFWP